MKSLLVVLILAACHYGNSDVPSQIFVSVYYESECSDSTKFIVEQLVPAVNLLGDRLKLQLVPFGKANSINDGDDGFECQHGPSECLGNLVQTCALHHMQDRSDAEKVSYVACEMTTLAGTTRNMECVESASLPLDLINECLDSDEGIELQLDAEDATKLFDPQFIPTIIINNEFNQQIQDQSQEDFVGMLCSLMKDDPCCAARYNEQALGNILL